MNTNDIAAKVAADAPNANTAQKEILCGALYEVSNTEAALQRAIARLTIALAELADRAALGQDLGMNRVSDRDVNEATVRLGREQVTYMTLVKALNA